MECPGNLVYDGYDNHCTSPQSLPACGMESTTVAITTKLTTALQTTGNPGTTTSLLQVFYCGTILVLQLNLIALENQMETMNPATVHRIISYAQTVWHLKVNVQATWYFMNPTKGVFYLHSILGAVVPLSQYSLPNQLSPHKAHSQAQPLA